MSTGTAEVLVPNGDGDDYIQRGIDAAQEHATQPAVDDEFQRIVELETRPNVYEVGRVFPSLASFGDRLRGHRDALRRQQVGIDAGYLTVRHDIPPMVE